MKSRHLFCLFSVFLFAMLMIGIAAAQSPRALPGKGKLPVGFAAPVSYSSGGKGPDSVAVADLNGDGKLDLAVANEFSASVDVLLGNGDGTFQPAVSYSSNGENPFSVAIGDVNGDGIPDIVVAILCTNGTDCSTGGVSVLLGNGDGTFQPPASYNSGGYYPASVALADLNGDGHADLVVANYCAVNSSCVNGVVNVLLGNGDGTFQSPVGYVTGAEATSVAIGDLNGDGYPDLVVTVQNQTVAVLLGNGDGTFEPPASYNSGQSEGRSVAIADFNRDGHPDLAVAGTGLTVLLGNGDGTFQAPVSYNPSGEGLNGVATADVNGDGFLDLVVAECEIDSCSSFGEVGLLIGNGDGTFQTAINYPSGGGYSTSLAIADLNADGKPDVVVTNENGENLGVMLNNNVPVKTTTAVASSLNPSQVNQSVTFTATVTSSRALPDGSTITFSHGKTTLGTGTTTNGVASLTTSFAKANTYSIKASYGGDVFHKASSGAVKQVVNR
jgi:hypothetical protein